MRGKAGNNGNIGEAERGRGRGRGRGKAGDNTMEI